MQYAQGKIGRVFIVNFEHGDDLLKEIERLAEREGLSFGVITFLGALAEGDIVTGPKSMKLPAKPVWRSFNNAMETVGFGTFTRKNNDTAIHIHASFGKGAKALTGCLRKKSKVFITVEALITEIKGVEAARVLDRRTGYHTLRVVAKKRKINRKNKK